VNTEFLDDKASPEMDGNAAGDSDAGEKMHWMIPTVTRLALSHVAASTGGNDDAEGLS